MSDRQISERIAVLRVLAAEANCDEDWARLGAITSEINALNSSRLGEAGAAAHVANLNAENDRDARRWEQSAAEARRAVGLTRAQVDPPAEFYFVRHGQQICEPVARVRIRAVRPRTRRRGAGAPARRKTASASSSGSSDGPGQPAPAPGRAAGELADQIIAAVLDELREGHAAELTATIESGLNDRALTSALVIATLALGDEGVRFDWAPVEPEPGETHRIFVFAEPKL